MRLRTPLAATALGAAVVLITAMPAAAAPYVAYEDIEIGDYLWEIQHDGDGDTFAVSETEYEDLENYFYDAWDDGYFGVWDDLGVDDHWHDFGCADADLSDADSNGDRVVSCGAETTGLDLVVDAEIRLFGEGDLSRYLVTVSNPTASAIDFSWEFYVNYGETSLRATTTHPTLGENDYEDDDLWSYNFESDGLSAATIWGLDESSISHERVSDDYTDDLWIWNDGDDGTQLTLDAGDSMTLAFFQKVDVAGTIAARNDFSEVTEPAGEKVESSVETNPARVDDGADFAPSSVELSPANDAAIAATLAEFDSFDGRLVRGIPSDVAVANWEIVPAAEEEEPELADTGAAPVTTALLGAFGALVLAGGLLVMRARRTAQR